MPGSWAQRARAELRASGVTVAGAVGEPEAAKAHQILESGRTIGKIVLTI